MTKEKSTHNIYYMIWKISMIENKICELSQLYVFYDMKDLHTRGYHSLHPKS